MVQLALMVLTLFLVPVQAQATTYYVATTGSNANAGTSESTPFLTVAHCVSTMLAGDTCYVRGGTYNEGVIRFSRTGTQAAPITLSNYPGELPVIVFQSFANLDRILIQHSSGQNRAMGWIIIQGLELTGGHDGIKFHSLHDSIIRNNHIHNVGAMGIMGVGGTRNLFERNIIHHNGRFAACDAGRTTLCFHDHGMYMHGSYFTIRNNVIYWHQGYGITQNGFSSAYSTTVHAGPEFAGATNWIIANNTFAYSRTRGGLTIWGPRTSNTRVENNIFYENSVEVSTAAQGVDFCCSANIGATGITLKNNHVYASGSGGTAFTSGGLFTSSGNVINVSPPAFVNGGSNSLPASPDFRLTASAPVNIALANEFSNNSTNVVGAYKTVATPTATITANKITATFPMSTAVPIQNLTTTGLTVGCTGANCPGSPAVSSVSRVAGTDSIVEIVVSGIAGNACVSTNQNWTITYNSSTGAWTANDNIGPYPGSHQKIFSFTSLAVTNQCTGSGPPGGTPSHISYPMDDGTGTTVSDTSGNAIHATLANGAGWAAGKTGTGVKATGGTTQQMTIPYGSGINPTTQSMTWVVPVFVATGQTQASNFVFGTEIGTDQRGYLAAALGTWVVGRQNVNTTTAGPSSLAVTEGWNHLCVRWDSATDTVTLYKNGVAGTGGATGSYTSYTFPTNLEAPILGTGFPSTVTETLYDDMQIFTSLQDCAALYAAWNAAPPAAVGTLAQAAIQFQGVILDTAGNPIVVGPAVQSIEVPAGGGVTILFQVHCQNIADCDATAFKLVYAKNGGTTWQQVPNTETADGTWMWGITTETKLNSGTRSTRLTGSCAVTTGSTQLTSEQIPAVDLPQDGCVVLAYIVRLGSTQAGNYFDYKLRTESDLDFTGGYTQTARVRVVNPMANVAW